MMKKNLKNSVPTLYMNNNNVDISSISTINNKHVLFNDNKKNQSKHDKYDNDILNDNFIESTKISKTSKKIKDLENGIDESDEEEEEKTNEDTENETNDNTTDDLNDEIEESEELENPEELQEELSSDDNEEENNNDELSSVDDSDGEVINKKKNNIKKNNDIDSDVEEGDNNDKCYYKYNSTKVDEEIDYDEIFKDDAKQIIKTERITKPFLTKYERVRLLSDRSRQLAQGAKPLVKNCTGLSHTEIARLELKFKKIPLKIQRPIPNAGTEEWRLDELEILE
jgi:DNA-directed RNA polymerase I, II, and III subunit RPABC2